jgi:hypothetical protein
MTVTIKLPASMGSWKTSLVGIISLVVAAWQGYQVTVANGSLLMALEDPKVQMFILSGIGLLLAKDAGVTGGTRGVPSTPQALADANQAPATGEHAPVGPAPVANPKP